MTVTIDATYENGVLKPKQPLALTEGSQVRVTLNTADEDHDPLEGVIGIGSSGRTDGADQHESLHLRNAKAAPAALMIFVDTWAWVALADKSDPYHRRAKAEHKRLRRAKQQYVRSTSGSG